MRRLFLLTDRFRKRRMSSFVAEFKPLPRTRILDVGGTETNWALTDVESSVTLFNLVAPEESQIQAGKRIHASLSWETGDGCAMPYPDAAFDICFSNSTIEHLHTFERQMRFAEEIRRVGRSYFVQTPAKSFPFEPHWLGFFVHWLPKPWRLWYARYFTLYGLVAKPTREHVQSLIDEYRLLTYREMARLFPEAQIRRERFLLLSKSYVAVHRARSNGRELGHQ